MGQRVHRWRAVLTALSVFMVFAVAPTQGGAQEKQQPSGGRLPEEKSVSRKVIPKSSTTSARTRTRTKSSAVTTESPRTSARSPIGPMDSIEGKWWTSSNDFGTSQVFFELNGTSVSGSIMYKDGRTGDLSGSLTGRKLNFTWSNSAGDQGTGSLEQSWNNFLGGTYRNQKGVTGSWTLSRVNGNWCFEGSRNIVRQVTHNERGQLFFLTEDSGQEVGHLLGPLIFLHGRFGNIKGTMDYQANRVDFAGGAYWTWCGPRVPQR